MKSALFNALLFNVECPHCGASVENPETNSYDWEPATLNAYLESSDDIECPDCHMTLPLRRKTAQI